MLEFANAAAIPATGAITVNNGGVLRFTSSAAVPPAGSITLNTGGAVEANASDPYTTVMGWLGSGKISTSSAGAIALSYTSNLAENISMGSYTNLSLGTTGYVTYTGTLTPAGSTYYLGGGGGGLTLSNANAVTGSRSLVITGPGW